jgi:hypothetical protein
VSKGGGGEYERWLLDGDVDVAVELLRRLAAQVTRTSSFRPPPSYSRWCDEAIDDLLAQMIEKKGVAFLVEALVSVDNQGSAERYLLRTVENFLKDEAKSTPHGKLRNRLDTILGQDPRFVSVSAPIRGWRLTSCSGDWWQGDVTDLEHAAFAVRGAFIRSWNTSGPTPAPARTALIMVALEVLTVAAGIVRAEDLARVLLSRFRHVIAPETSEELALSGADERLVEIGHEPESVLARVSAEELWMTLTLEQRAIVPYLTTPEDAVVMLGIGRREAKARAAQVVETVRLATVDDPHAEEVVTELLHLGSLAVAPMQELGRPTCGEPNETGGRMDP